MGMASAKGNSHSRGCFQPPPSNSVRLLFTNLSLRLRPARPEGPRLARKSVQKRHDLGLARDHDAAQPAEVELGWRALRGALRYHHHRPEGL